MPRLLKYLSQRGRSNIRRDRKLRAYLPGRRVSRSGRRYTERRKNRSDRRRSRV